MDTKRRCYLLCFLDILSSIAALACRNSPFGEVFEDVKTVIFIPFEGSINAL